jgi:outer membrane receptor protein involved in Fe transport
MELSYHQGDVEKVTFESVLARRFDIWNNDLADFAFYVQDKIEVRDGFIINAGLRFDYYNPNGFGPVVYYPENPAELADPSRRRELTADDKVPSRWQISPRIGISHPITERDKIHFYYGHFFQRPDMRYLFENSNDLVKAFLYTTNVDIGNPRLRPEKTVSYEVGWDHLFGDELRLGVTGYFKDITNLVAALDYDFAGSAEPFQAYGNLDYANVRGLEFTLETIGIRAIGGMINYSYAFADGRSSSVFRSNGEIVPRRLDPLDWDVRHKINANILLRSTGIIQEYIGDAEMNFVVTVRSGYPYTRNTRDVFPLFALRNDGRLPWSKNVDMRFRKGFSIAGVDFSVLAEVRNLFNWINVSYIAGGREGIAEFEQTGDPTGPYDHPTTWTRPRVYRLGLELQM